MWSNKADILFFIKRSLSLSLYVCCTLHSLWLVLIKKPATTNICTITELIMAEKCLMIQALGSPIAGKIFN